MRRVILAGLAALAMTLVVFAATARADGYNYCPTPAEAVAIISHKSDVEHGEPAWVKERLLQLASRESGLLHCWSSGVVKISPTADHGLFQFNERGVWLNCALNPHCGDRRMLDDVFAQVDVILNYYDRYGDFCPWNPARVNPNYNPGCGYR